jgi:phosphatidate cytidylyltransferase
MLTRVLVALVGIPFLLAVILLLPPVATAILVSAMCAIAAYELLWRTGLAKHVRLVCYAGAMGVLVSFWSLSACVTPWAGAAVFVFFAVLFCELLAGHTKLGFAEICYTAFAGLVVPLALSALVRLRAMPQGGAHVVTSLVMAFSADSAAYFAGRAFGKHKLAPVISPHKTVEGAIGGVLGSVGMMLLYALVLQSLHTQVHYAAAALYGFLGAFASMLGDLTFSVIKRQTGIKDYGTLLPGHGGILDRFDSMVAVAPLTEILWLLLPFFDAGTKLKW